MTQFTDKPKRKEKPKRGRSRRTLRLGLLVIITALVLFLMLHDPSTQPAFPEDIFNPPDGDPLTASCEFATDVKAFVNNRTSTFVKDLRTDTIVQSDIYFRATGTKVDSPYVWGMDNGRQQEPYGRRILMNIETGEITQFEKSRKNEAETYSQTNRYLAVVFHNQVDKSANMLTIYDGEQARKIIDINTENMFATWSPSDRHLLLTRLDNPSGAQLLDMVSLTFSSAGLPEDTYLALGWLNDTTLLYQSSDHFLKIWDTNTNESSKYLNMEIDRVDTTYNFSITRRSILDHPIGILHSDRQNFTYIDVMHPETEHTFPVDTVPEHYAIGVYDGAIKMYSTLDQTEGVTYFMDNVDEPVHRRLQNVSWNGRYSYERVDQSNGDILIYDLITEETLILDVQNPSYINWEMVEGIHYLLYAVPTENGSSVFYLFQPETRSRCKVGTFYFDHFEFIA